MAPGTLLVDTSFLGDVLCAEPLVRATAARWPDAPVDFLTSPGGAEILRGHPDLREILVFDKRGAERGLGGLRRMARRLRERHYARALCSHRSWRTALLLAMARIPERVAFANAAASWAYTRRVPYRSERHEIERNLGLVGSDGWQRPRMHPSAEERERAAALAPREGFVAVAPGSLWATKRWPEARFCELVASLYRAGHVVVLLGGPDDVGLCARIAETSGGAGESPDEPRARVRSLAGRTSIRESYAVLERAACLVTNDSAPMHLGVAAGIPVVAVYCSTVPGFGFAPRGPQDVVLEVNGLACRPCGIHGHPSCPEGHFRCGWDVPASAAMQAVRERVAQPLGA